MIIQNISRRVPSCSVSIFIPPDNSNVVFRPHVRPRQTSLDPLTGSEKIQIQKAALRRPGRTVSFQLTGAAACTFGREERLLHLRVRDLGGLLRQAAALRWDQVVVLGADVLVGVMEAAWTGPGRRSEEKSRTGLLLTWFSASTAARLTTAERR